MTTTYWNVYVVHLPIAERTERFTTAHGMSEMRLRNRNIARVKCGHTGMFWVTLDGHLHRGWLSYPRQ